MAAISKSTKSALRIVQIVLQVTFNIFFYMVVFLLVIRLSGAVYDFSYQIFGDVTVEEVPGHKVTFEVEKGESVLSLGRRLGEERLVVNPYSFAVRAKLTVGKRHPILPGTYKLNTSMTYDEILAVLTNTELTTDDE